MWHGVRTSVPSSTPNTCVGHRRLSRRRELSPVIHLELDTVDETREEQESNSRGENVRARSHDLLMIEGLLGEQPAKNGEEPLDRLDGPLERGGHLGESLAG